MRKLESGRRYTYSDSLVPRHSTVRTLSILVGMLAALCWHVARCNGGDGPSSGKKSAAEHPYDLEFRAAWAELTLAKRDEPYLVLDLGRRVVDLRLKGALLWTCPLRYEASDSEAVRRSDSELAGERGLPVAFLSGKHLYSRKARFADSVLTVIARVAHVDADHLQRYEPGHFELRFGRSLVIDVRTDAAARPTSQIGNVFARARRVLLAPLTKAEIKVRMEPEEALTLYRAAHPSLPILIYPPTR